MSGSRELALLLLESDDTNRPSPRPCRRPAHPEDRACDREEPKVVEGKDSFMRRRAVRSSLGLTVKTTGPSGCRERGDRARRHRRCAGTDRGGCGGGGDDRLDHVGMGDGDDGLAGVGGDEFVGIDGAGLHCNDSPPGNGSRRDSAARSSTHYLRRSANFFPVQSPKSHSTGLSLDGRSWRPGDRCRGFSGAFHRRRVDRRDVLQRAGAAATSLGHAGVGEVQVRGPAR